ncbi:fructose-specific PTS system IIA component [Ligilactobacillus salitolerans]|uniref:Fructose-specific PTS system IIA component n=1 Tax=Ligilactobacillus salitolerans TaxID=1808352 RepID=A0A401IV81_9LACO|nr:PTS sugar transporter subunit IIA [Ligilactobacillus salitolerans]GBG95453.1 fructose-specific PTS system IIA component [Ligilactobacillus salitolerans]
MELAEIIQPELVSYDLEASNQKEVINKMAELLVKQGVVLDQDEFVASVFAREKTGTTGIGAGIAIPHGQADTVTASAVAIAKLHEAVEWKSLDDKPVIYVFLLAIPNSGAQEHLQLLSQLAEDLMDDDVRAKLEKSQSAQDLMQVFQK